MGSARRWILGASAICLIAMLACSGDKPAGQSDDELVRANSLITQSQYSEAIFILTARLQATPSDEKARILLASAYAARAGLILTSYTNFANQIVQWGQVDELVPTNSADDGPVLTALATVASTALKVELVVKAFDSLPSPTSQTAIDDLNQAVQVLSDGGELHAGPAIYRALLRTTLLKHDLSGKYKLTTSIACEVQTGALSTWFTSIDDAIQAILADVADGLADQTQAQSVRDKAAQIKTQVDSLAKLLTAPEIAEQTLKIPPSLVEAFGVCQ